MFYWVFGRVKVMFYWVLWGFTGFPVEFFFGLLDLNGFCCVFKEFGKLLHIFTGFLLGFTGFYWVVLGCTGFYWVLLGFTGLY